jgi:bifunctional DNA-binding transcriptional regulator/antitoxin component of YhaV-PrlF toxin-antitoxin module
MIDGMTSEVLWVTLSEGGRIVIPSEMRRAIGAKIGERLGLALDDCGELHLFTRAQGIKRAQQIFAPFAPDSYSLVDEFIAERHAEAERE